MHQFLNFYSKYPWVAIIIIAQWLTTVLLIIFFHPDNIPLLMAIMFISTIFYGYFGFQIPKE